MNENFDSVLMYEQTEAGSQPQQVKPEPFDKAAYAARKRSGRDECYRLADVTAEKVASSAELYAAYLNVQARYNRYSVNNALLLTAQYPKATKLATFEEWRKNGAQIAKGSKGIMLLEPGKEYMRADGSTGTNFRVKKVFDISQTDAPPLTAEIHRDQRLLMRALIHNAPCRLAFDDALPAGVQAQYKPDSRTVFVRHGLEGDDMFRALARELAFAHLDKGDGFSRTGCEFRAKSIAFLVCARNHIAAEAVVVPASYSNLEAKAFKKELQQINEVANTMHGNMEQVLGKQQRDQMPQKAASADHRDAR